VEKLFSAFFVEVAEYDLDANNLVFKEEQTVVCVLSFCLFVVSLLCFDLFSFELMSDFSEPEDE